MAHGGRARERTRAANRCRLLTLGGTAVPSVDPGLEYRHPRCWPEAAAARRGTGTPRMIAGSAGSPGKPSTFLFPPPRRRELTDSSEPDEGVRDNCQGVWIHAA